MPICKKCGNSYELTTGSHLELCERCHVYEGTNYIQYNGIRHDYPDFHGSTIGQPSISTNNLSYPCIICGKPIKHIYYDSIGPVVCDECKKAIAYVKKHLMEEKERMNDYYIKDRGYILYDICKCASKDCMRDCARKRVGQGIDTYSDFSLGCASYLPKEKK